MASESLWAVVPLKDLRRAKLRLAPVLSPDERVALARTMALDVLAAIAAVDCLAGIAVVGEPASARAIAGAANIRVIDDGESGGTLSAAVAAAARVLIGEGATGMLVIPADVPAVTPAEIEAALDVHDGYPAVTLVPAIVDAGTNGLLCSPPDAIPPRFGPASLRRHCSAAQAGGIVPRLLHLEGWGRDVDRPADLVAYAATPSATQSYRYLIDSGIGVRLRGPERSAGLPRRIA